MANMLFANNANTTLNSGITAIVTSMVVTSATGFPAPTGSQYFYCTLADAATQTTIEIVKVTAVSGTTFTIVRGQDGTSGTAFSSGAVVSLRLVRASLNDFPKLDEVNTFSQTQTFSAAPITSTLTGFVYGNGASAQTVATNAQLLTLLGTLPVGNGGTGLTTLTAGYIPYGNGTSAFSSSSSLYFDGTNMGIGTTTTSGGTMLTVAGAIASTGDITAHSASKIVISQPNVNSSYIRAYGPNTTTVGELRFLQVSSDYSIVSTSGMFNANNNLLIGCTVSGTNIASTGTPRITGANILSAYDPANGNAISVVGTSGITGLYFVDGAFRVFNNSNVGVYLNNGATSWAGTSDERLKDIIEPIQNGLQKVASLRAIIGKYKDDETNTRRSFLIAQDVQKVLPEAVSVLPNSDGILGISYTDVIPLLVSAIKELKTEFDAYVASHP